MSYSYLVHAVGDQEMFDAYKFSFTSNCSFLLFRAYVKYIIYIIFVTEGTGQVPVGT